MLQSDLIEIGSHTLTHDNLPTLDIATRQKEIQASREAIEREFGIECRSFCYPFGLYDSTDVEIVKNSGYSSATTTKVGISDITKTNLYELDRITVSGKDNFVAFLLKLRHGKRGVGK
jgi:peptidoglycan/xylan/chitin deacetylase (PgdA/CDA1 family)